MWPEALPGGEAPGGMLKKKGELDGDLVGHEARDRDKADAWCKGGRAEGLMDLAAWIDGERLEFIKISGGEEYAGNLPSTGGTSAPMAVKRPDREGGIGAPGTSVRDHG